MFIRKFDRLLKASLHDRMFLLELFKTVDIAILKSAGVIRHDAIRAKVIASGSIERAVVLRGISVTRGARAAIEQAGGKVEA